MLNPIKKFKVTFLHMKRPQIDWFFWEWTKTIMHFLNLGRHFNIIAPFMVICSTDHKRSYNVKSLREVQGHIFTHKKASNWSICLRMYQNYFALHFLNTRRENIQTWHVPSIWNRSPGQHINLIKGPCNQLWPRRSKTHYCMWVSSFMTWKLAHLMISKYLDGGGAKMTPAPMLGSKLTPRTTSC